MVETNGFLNIAEIKSNWIASARCEPGDSEAEIYIP